MTDGQKASHGIVSKLTKRALEPLVQAGVTAATAYLTRKGLQLWEEKLLPKLQEKGGGRAVARESLEAAADKLGGPASETITAVAEKVAPESPSPARKSSTSHANDAGREEERRERAQRRRERRRSLEQSGST